MIPICLKSNSTDRRCFRMSGAYDIVVWSGLRPRMDEAEKFAGSADEVLLISDYTVNGGTIQKTIRSKFFVASQA